ncbi:NUDIX hydrolase [Amycolatopsis suaedae]|uniref:NUDIX hydrolase n=2 Tax=Amycolatopsis suaedae TaxID=2510978 RepID=A0A4Q7J7I4_9PSEU|nr:NUDIX hydrolase [Amycolatopsis suaedae]
MHHLDADQAARFFQDMNAEGEPEKEFNPGIASRIPGKTVAAGALIQDGQGRLLFVTPIYKPYLEIPGGVVNSNEPPHAACQREVREELGLDIELGGLLVVDWTPQHGVWRDSLQFIFDGGVLPAEQAQRITLPYDELKNFQFAELDQVAKQLKPSLHRRLQQAVAAKEAGTATYSEFGRS